MTAVVPWQAQVRARFPDLAAMPAPRLWAADTSIPACPKSTVPGHGRTRPRRYVVSRLRSAGAMRATRPPAHRCRGRPNHPGSALRARECSRHWERPTRRPGRLPPDEMPRPASRRSCLHRWGRREGSEARPAGPFLSQLRPQAHVAPPGRTRAGRARRTRGHRGRHDPPVCHIGLSGTADTPLVTSPCRREPPATGGGRSGSAGSVLRIQPVTRTCCDPTTAASSRATIR